MYVRIFDNLKKMRAKLKEITNSGIDASPALRMIGTYYTGQIDRTFIKEGERDGHPRWKALSARTIAIRLSKARKQGKGTKRAAEKSGRSGKVMILQDTGLMRRSFIPGGIDNTFRVGKDFVTVGTSVPYAKKHQTGDDVPKREIIFFTEKDKKMFPKILLDFYKARLLERQQGYENG